jgi:cytochrome c biogenesis protein CcmG/thiol:disulfide interchange protein DsbE
MLNRVIPVPKTRLSWIVVIVIVLILGGGWIGLTRVSSGQGNPTGRQPAPRVGHPAPDFSLTALDGEEIALSDFQGQPVVLNFWTTWCPPCRAEVPALQATSETFAGEAVVLGVSVEETPATVRSFAEEFGVTYPVALDQSAQVYHTYRIRSFPTTYFIDAQGVVVEIVAGSLNEPLIATHLAEMSGQ